MSESDDWENQLDSDNEADKKEEEAKKKKFADEDIVDAEALKKQKAEQAKKEQQEKEKLAKIDNALNKDSNKKNYDELWEKRQKDLPNTKINTEGMTDAQKGLAVQLAAEGQMTNDLFGADDEDQKVKVKDWKLNSEKDYKEFGKHTGKILYKGSTPYRVENFFRELCKDLPEHCDSKQIDGIVQYMKSVFNQKQKAEKEERDGKNKKKKKAEIKGGGGKGYEFNNNPGMVADVMGIPAVVGDDDYGDYGDEQAFRKEGEATYDFM